MWIYTSWVTNWLDPERVPVRASLFVLMLAGLVLSASIPKAFSDLGFAFAATYVFMQVGRTLFFLWAVRGAHVSRVRNFLRILVWFCLSAVFWIAGAFADGDARLGLWALALAIEFVAPSLYFFVPGLGRSTLADWDVDGAHMAERCALFIIIALGECRQPVPTFGPRAGSSAVASRSAALRRKSKAEESRRSAVHRANRRSAGRSRGERRRPVDQGHGSTRRAPSKSEH